ncbi:AMP-binding protein [Haloferula chungangensis]|uniref:AMP-binding protein n=1 Tax=Haloferula chungangensis TaxID=1048331 RepID=A0ABW2LAQ9_9BACT
METTYLRDPAFWTSTRPEAPGSNFVVPNLQDGELDGLVFFQTSGSMAWPHWVGLSREALLLSAAVVNAHLQVDSASCWGLALPLNHVGGFGVVARAYEAGCRLDCFREKWDPARFSAWLKAEQVSHVSLVPTQVHDLVREWLRPPPSLKVVVVGGGGLDEETGRAARGLGWPVLASYGMTEAGSQIATQGVELLDQPYECSPIPILPHWKVRIEDDGRIALSGRALFAGELIQSGERWHFSKRREEWYRTKDLGRLDGGDLNLTGRADAVVKILGELVDPIAVEHELAIPEVTVIAVRDPRKEHRLMAVYENGSISNRVESRVQAYNESVTGVRRIDELVKVDAIPRSQLGKVRRFELSSMLESLRV